jgi:proline racemase
LISVHTIDAHAAGGPLRLIVGGFPSPRGDTMADKVAWLEEHADPLRRLLLHAPRGHEDLLAALLTEPVTAGAHAGLVFMDGAAYVPISGHAIVAATTIACERRLITDGGPATDGMRFDTAAGLVAVTPDVVDEAGRVRVRAVTFTGPPSFVLYGGLGVRVAGREVAVDVASGSGALYAIADSEAAGLGLEPRYLPELRRMGVAITSALEARFRIQHPADTAADRLRGTVFTAAPHHEDADLRLVAVTGDGRIDFSPGGTAISAVLAVVDAMGVAPADRPFVAEGLAGGRFEARMRAGSAVSGAGHIVCAVTGSAWITGEHTFIGHDDDPLRPT